MSEQSGSKARLKALTPEAAQAIGGPVVPLTCYPFRVGRESRRAAATRALLGGGERREGGAKPNNDLYVLEQTHEVYVSREHFEIQKTDSGFQLVDRASALGTWVEGTLVGGSRAGGKSPIRSGDVIIIASYHSGLIFKFLVDGA